MNPVQDGGNTPRKRENSAKSGKVGMSALLSYTTTATRDYIHTAQPTASHGPIIAQH